MISNPLFSIIVCTYNRKSLISRCINSILNQTIKDFEIIIVDDCSSDGTYDFLLTYNDPRIRLFKTEIQSGGASVPRNLGIKNSKGKYLAFCDSDDFYNNSHLENSLLLIKKYNLKEFILGFNAIAFDNKGKTSIYFKKSNLYFRKISLLSMFFNNKIIFSSLVMTNKNIKIFIPNQRPNEDYVFLLNNIKFGKKAYYCNSVSINYNINNSDSITSRNSRYEIFFSKYHDFKMPRKYYFTYPFFLTIDLLRFLFK